MPIGLFDLDKATEGAMPIFLKQIFGPLDEDIAIDNSLIPFVAINVVSLAEVNRIARRLLRG